MREFTDLKLVQNYCKVEARKFNKSYCVTEHKKGIYTIEILAAANPNKVIYISLYTGISFIPEIKQEKTFIKEETGKVIIIDDNGNIIGEQG